MLQADRDAVHAQLGERAVMLRHQELRLYANGLKAVAMQAALVSGFTLLGFFFMSFIRKTTAQNDDFFVLYVAMLGTFGLGVLAQLVATLATIYGPGLALQGNGAAAERAVRLMRRALYTSLAFLLWALLGLFVVLASLSWLSLIVVWQRVLVVGTLVVSAALTGSALRTILRDFRATGAEFAAASAKTNDLTQAGAGGPNGGAPAPQKSD